jgi:glycosyltransferase involved in cell wall biosynthesis
VPAESVAVYVVTYRRPWMLRRAIRSVLEQTHRDIALYVVNDDPTDVETNGIVHEFDDPRVSLYQPVKKRGATCNFNLVFREQAADFSALLEDDNWWEPTFLERQLNILRAYPLAPIVVSNERIWKELPNDQWQDTGYVIWPFGDVRLFRPTLETLCTGATLRNSSLVVRTALPSPLLTPDDIPVDVTELFRERLIVTSFPLNGEPLVNYAKTLITARDDGRVWGRYQLALIGSTFKALVGEPARRKLARALWRSTTSPTSPRANTLVQTGLAIKEARALLALAPAKALLRSTAGFMRRPQRLADVLFANRKMAAHIDFLVNAPLTQVLAREFEAA